MPTELSRNDLIFRPRLFLRNRHIQSVFSSLKFLAPPHHAVLDVSRDMIIETRQRSKLLAHVSPAPVSRGLLIILHGWEGSSSSAYVMAASSFFYERGYSICRLNLRDHGHSHHLNEGLFHGALLDETFDAVKTLSLQAENLPAYLLGFSMGANFSLRIAVKHAQTPIANLRGVFAVSPPLDPYKATLSIDQGPSFYRKYFLKKWKRSLRIKQKLFPHKYDFTDILQSQTCLNLTEGIMTHFPEFPSYRDYFKEYTLTGSFLQGLNLPVSILIAEDDPVIPLEDFNSICENSALNIIRQPLGGHCGFLDLCPYRRWYHELVLDRLESFGRHRQ